MGAPAAWYSIKTPYRVSLRNQTFFVLTVSKVCTRGPCVVGESVASVSVVNLVMLCDNYCVVCISQRAKCKKR